MAGLTIISLGWGVQSWTLAAMSALGELPPADFALHSDTSWERAATYEFSRQWGPWLEERGVRLAVVDDYRAARQIADDSGHTHAPLYTANGESNGQLRRSCTQRWKIAPMRRFIRRELERRGIVKGAGAVEQWLGITKDEWTRAKDSDVSYIEHRFPLLELNMSRADCLEWLAAHDLPSPGKSACTFCPYHSLTAWQAMKRDGGPDWQQAVALDQTIRDKRPPYPLFVHPARVPLEQAVVIPEDFGASQLSLLESADQDAPCDSGYCFL